MHREAEEAQGLLKWSGELNAALRQENEIFKKEKEERLQLLAGVYLGFTIIKTEELDALRQEVERLRKEMEAQKIWHELF
jgi:hypothetical protein